ncbi:HAMP domain-containing protein [Mycoplasmatota bacterium]|nr:HAMP domain-containing protein [Mycoplasmatota bacterium]
MSRSHLTSKQQYDTKKLKRQHTFSGRISKGFRRILSYIFFINLLLIISFLLLNIYNDNIKQNEYIINYTTFNSEADFINFLDNNIDNYELKRTEDNTINMNYVPHYIFNQVNFDLLDVLNRSNWVFRDVQLITVNEDNYELYTYVTLGNIVDEFTKFETLLFFGTLAAVSLIGAVLMRGYSSLAARSVTKPIRDISRLTKDITVQNLNMRLDVDVRQKELRELIVTINRMLDRIYDDYQMHRRFVSDVSHELRTPLSVIDGYANMLNRWAKDDQEVFDESVNAIIDESKNMKLLVENLLILARHDNKTTSYKMKQFNLSELVQDVYKETLLINEEKHKVSSNITSNIVVRADEHKIKQSIRIFVDNALKYTPEGETININLSYTNSHAIIEVRDTGIGIAKKDLNKVFDRFYRSDESRSRKTGGHGLGLSLAKAIIKDHDGKITVKSAISRGTIVKIKLMAN